MENLKEKNMFNGRTAALWLSKTTGRVINETKVANVIFGAPYLYHEMLIKIKSKTFRSKN